MTPYEGALTKKLTQAIELSNSLMNGRKLTGISCDPFPEEPILQDIIQRINSVSHQFDRQLQRYQELSEARKCLALDASDSIKQVTSRLWEDIGYQFKAGTVANDLLKVLCQKIQRFPLPPFPVSRRKPLLYKDVCLHEDSYALLGQYFSWLTDLLLVVNFTPIRPPFCLTEMSHKADRYTLLTEQIRREAEALRESQLIKVQLYKQLNQAISRAKGRLLVHRREIR